LGRESGWGRGHTGSDAREVEGVVLKEEGSGREVVRLRRIFGLRGWLRRSGLR
jgi:hypothetical protein